MKLPFFIEEIKLMKSRSNKKYASDTALILLIALVIFILVISLTLLN